MICYTPFWDTMEEKQISQYQLIHYWNISSNTLRRMKKNEPISTTTLNELCLILECPVEKILAFEASQEEASKVKERRKEIPVKELRRRSK